MRNDALRIKFAPLVKNRSRTKKIIAYYFPKIKKCADLEARMDDRAIAIFDSGLGGLTALKALRELLPGEDVIFFGDSARAPYGSREREELIKMSLQDLRFVLDFDVKAVLVACGTSSSNAMEMLKEVSPVPVVGVIDCAAEAAARTGSRRLGVIATEATIKSGAYQRALALAAPGAEITARACPAFVPLVEAGRFGKGDPETAKAVTEALEPFRDAKTEALLLGCTHYPLLTPEILSVLPGIRLISNSQESVRELAESLRKSDSLSSKTEGGVTEFYTSGDAEAFREHASLFLGRNMSGKVSHIAPFSL